MYLMRPEIKLDGCKLTILCAYVCLTAKTKPAALCWLVVVDGSIVLPILPVMVDSIMLPIKPIMLLFVRCLTLQVTHLFNVPSSFHLLEHVVFSGEASLPVIKLLLKFGADCAAAVQIRSTHGVEPRLSVLHLLVCWSAGMLRALYILMTILHKKIPSEHPTSCSHSM